MAWRKEQKVVVGGIAATTLGAAITIGALSWLGWGPELSFVDLPFTGGDDNALTTIAKETCTALEGAGPSQAASILPAQENGATTEGFTTIEFEDALQSECADRTDLVRLVHIAQETCSEMEGAIVLQASGILNRGITRAEQIGRSAPDLGDSMRVQCPDLIAALQNVSDEQQRREQLPSLMAINFRCDPGGAVGVVRNDSDVTVDVFIDIGFLDDNGILIESSIGSVSGLRPRETGTWDGTFIGSFSGRSYATCRASVSSAFEQ